MARFRMDVNLTDNTQRISRRMNTILEDAMTDVVLDLKRVASGSAPHRTGFLERNAQHDISVSNGKLVGSVGFSAVEHGFNYAQWTHDKKYDLGEKSARKRGGLSGIGHGGIVPVGTGYLENALNMNKRGYLQYLQEKYEEALR